jgi:hypothetical protein
MAFGDLDCVGQLDGIPCCLISPLLTYIAEHLDSNGRELWNLEE